VHEHGKESESHLGDICRLLELVHHVDGEFDGESLQLYVVAQSPLGEQAVLDGEA